MNRSAPSVETVLSHAVEIADPAERQGYVDQACGGDADLQGRVERLIANHFLAGSFLEEPAAVLAPGTTEGRETAGGLGGLVGTMIGPYRLLEQIGEGGMGLVFVAEQERPIRRRVALKVIKPGMDSRQVVARFEAERQALAIMDHPNIARVHDGGATPEGRPYFVMELVRGTPITDYCDGRKLTTRQRLELFVDVCHAVQHAHQKGIIHRDLKPSNVLVSHQDVRAVVKVIDFGIAKAVGQRLTEGSVYTGFGQMIGTPLYMSPEQAGLSDLDVDTRSDVYSLGVLLYELLTGTTPFAGDAMKNAGYDEIRRIIREVEPARPSARLTTFGQAQLSTVAERRGLEPRRLTRELRGELDWVVMKALEKDRSRRYESANAFAADVRRYLADEAVEACPPSVAYRVRKFSRRHRLGLGLAAGVLAVLLLLSGGLGWVVNDRTGRAERTTVEIQSALEESAEWQQRRRVPEALAAARRAKAILAGGHASSALRQKVESRLGDLELLSGLEEARLEGSMLQNGLVDYRGMEQRFGELFQASGLDLETLALDEAGRRIRNTSVALELAAVLDDWAAVRRQIDPKSETRWKILLDVARAADPDGYRAMVRDALERGDGVGLKDLAASNEAGHLMPWTWSAMGRAMARSGRTMEAKDLLKKAQQQHPDDFWINFNLQECILHIVNEQEIVVWPEEAISFQRVCAALRPQNAEVHFNLGFALCEKGDLDAAIVEYREGIRLKKDHPFGFCNLGTALFKKGRFEEAIGAYHEAIRLDKDLAEGHYSLANTLKAVRDLDGAIREYREAIRLKEDYVEAHNNLGVALCERGRRKEAIAPHREAVRLRPKFAEGHFNLGNVLIQEGDPEGAIKAYRLAIHHKPDYTAAHYQLASAFRATGKFEQAAGSYLTVLRHNPESAEVHNDLGLTYFKLERLDEAIGEYQKALRLEKDFFQARNNLAGALFGRGDLDGALREYRGAVSIKSDYFSARFGLGVTLTEMGRIDEAIGAYREAILYGPDDTDTHHNLGTVLLHDGQFAEALASLRRSRELGSKDPSWQHNTLSARLIKQCKRFLELESRLPGILASKEQPADAGERFEYADLCQKKHLYAAAVRLHRDAMKATPKLLESPANKVRYNAACAAALAGCGAGKDAAKLTDDERAAFRKQARDWLRADLEVCGGLFDKEPRKHRLALAQAMAHWLADRDFDGVRDAKALAKLPKEEREAWNGVWKQVAAVLERAKAKK